ncbi:helix-turn-helix transcriptional regulator [Corynebacterium amycolatum]|nr:helix-turn-helix transcriptional regulator [Corynebacterium amycolatum]
MFSQENEPRSESFATNSGAFGVSEHGRIPGVAETSGVAASTISDILNGNTWPSLETMARLEVSLGVRLWPGVKTAQQDT